MAKDCDHTEIECTCSDDNELAYPIQVRLLNRFHELYEAGKVDYGYPKGFVEYFATQHFMLDEVIKAYQRGKKDGSEQKNHET